MAHEGVFIFYDGDCGFCNRTVQFVLKNERKNTIQFSALQSEFSRELFESEGCPIDLSTFYLLEDYHIYNKSTGALRLIKYLKWYWQPLQVFWLIPRCFRDDLYNFVAKRRRKISAGYCLVPSATNAHRFKK